MKPLLAIAIFFISLAHGAAKQCSQYQLRGEILIKDKMMMLVLAKSTLSELKLVIPDTLQDRGAPYIDHTVLLTTIIDSSSISARSKILEISDIKSVTPDPLNQNESTVMKRIREIQCP